MKLLITIVSCQAHAANHQAVRDTWMKDVPPGVDCFFFVGQGAEPAPDTIVVDAPDDYFSLALKRRAIFRWACEREYDFTFKICEDNWVDVGAYLRSGFEKYDYFGHIHTWPGGNPTFPYGYIGPDGETTSLKANLILKDAPVDIWCDDGWVGNVLGAAGIPMKHDVRFGTVDMPASKNTITRHGSLEMGGTGKYKPEWMYQVHDLRKRGVL